MYRVELAVGIYSGTANYGGPKAANDITWAAFLSMAVFLPTMVFLSVAGGAAVAFVVFLNFQFSNSRHDSDRSEIASFPYLNDPISSPLQ